MPSYPARGTWIEMTTACSRSQRRRVVPRTGYVDRNLCPSGLQTMCLCVVPRTGYVDRNVLRREPGSKWLWSYPARGTWIEITEILPFLRVEQLSYPARGTWIEMRMPTCLPSAPAVVPRTGYVDRNFNVCAMKQNQRVVPRTGYVDRNTVSGLASPESFGRTPHGVRG